MVASHSVPCARGLLVYLVCMDYLEKMACWYDSYKVHIFMPLARPTHSFIVEYQSTLNLFSG